MESHYAVDAKRLRRSNTVIIINNNNNNDNREFHTLLYPDDVLNKKQSTVLYILTYTARPGTSAGRQPAQPLLGSSPHTLGRRTGRLRTDGTPRRMGVLGAQQGRDHLGTGRGYGVVLRPLRL